MDKRARGKIGHRMVPAGGGGHMLKIGGGLVAVWASLLSTACTSTVGAETPSKVSICDIIHTPQHYDRTAISVRGIVAPDRHRTGIFDIHCADRVIAFGPERQVEHGLDDFYRAMATAREQAGSHVETTAVGEIEWRPGQVPYIVLMVTEFSDTIVVQE